MKKDIMHLIHRINRHPCVRAFLLGFPLIVASHIFVTKDCPWAVGSLLALTLFTACFIIDMLYERLCQIKELLEAES